MRIMPSGIGGTRAMIMLNEQRRPHRGLLISAVRIAQTL
jgi:hypothetical protein